MQEALHKCTHASHSLKACYALTHRKTALVWPVQVCNMVSWCTAQPQGCAAVAIAWSCRCSCACLHRLKKVAQSCTAQCFHILTACLYHLVLKHACLIIFLSSRGATTLSVWSGGAAKVRGSHHNALDAQQQHPRMRNEDQYLIQIYSQGALPCI